MDPSKKSGGFSTANSDMRNVRHSEDTSRLQNKDKTPPRKFAHEFEDLLPHEFSAVKAEGHKLVSNSNEPRNLLMSKPFGSSSSAGGSARRPHFSAVGVSPLPSEQYQSATQWLQSSDVDWGNPQPHAKSTNPLYNAQEAQAWENQVSIWFSQADVNGDGRVAGKEASSFFRKSGVPDSSLSEMWRYAHGQENGLDRGRFSNALKFLAILQSGARLSSDVAASCAAQPYPHIWPCIPSSDELEEVMSEESSEATTSYASSHSASSQPSTISKSHTNPSGPPRNPVAPSWLISQLDHMGMAPQNVPAAVETVTPRPNAISSGPLESCDTPEDMLDAAFITDARLVAAEVRLPSLYPNKSAKLRVLAGAHGSLLAGPSESGGLLEWAEVINGMDATAGDGSRLVRSEDADSAPCQELGVETDARVLSLVVEEKLDFLWTGLDNGSVSSFRIVKGDGGSKYTKVSSWKAHKHSGVTAMAVTGWGELWTGSNRGSLKIWPNAMSLVGSKGGRALKRSDSEKAHGETQSIVVTTCGSIVWSAGHNNICLWAAYGGQFLGRIQTDKSMDDELDEKSFRINTRQGLDVSSSGRVKSIPKFGDKLQSDSEEIEQEGRMLKGAVGQVARILHKGVRKAGEKVMARSNQLPNHYFPEDTLPHKFGHIRGMEAMADNTIWVAYKNGYVERYTYSGRFTTRLSCQYHISTINCVGERLWIGLVDGSIGVVSHDAKELKTWLAHEESVCAITTMGPLVFTLSTDGSIKCWSSRIPDPSDAKAWQMLSKALPHITQKETISILCGTWNVNETRPASESLIKWLGGRRSGMADIVIIGLQEIEMGTSSVAKSWVIDTVLKSGIQERGNTNAQWWSNEILNALEHEENNIDANEHWKKVGMRQMAGILVYIFARSKFHPYIGSMSTSSVGTGIMGFGGNKGAVAVSFTLYRRRVVAVCSHFAAHQDGVEKRNHDYASIVRQLTFQKDTVPRDAQAGPNPTVARTNASAMQLQRPVNQDVRRTASDPVTDIEDEDIGLSRGLQRAELLVWVGDFNYRVEMTYQEAYQAIVENRLRDLLQKDQCIREMRRNKVFHGLKEGEITFQPTYKFDKGLESPLAYDSSEKMRVPSWTDRIFFRGSKPIRVLPRMNDHIFSSNPAHLDNLIHMTSQIPGSTPQSSNHEGPEADEVYVQCVGYNSVPSVTDSDHKPVWSLLRVAYPKFIQQKRRQTCFAMLRNTMPPSQSKVLLDISSESMVFNGDSSQTISVKNKGSDKTMIWVSWNKQHKHMPRWLEVWPQQFLLHPENKGVFHVTVAMKQSSAGNFARALYANLSIMGTAVGTAFDSSVHRHEVQLIVHPKNMPLQLL